MDETTPVAAATSGLTSLDVSHLELSTSDGHSNPGFPQTSEHPGVAKERRRTAILRGLTYGLLLNAFLVTFLTIIFPMIRGAIPFTVLSNSMAPAMPVGSLAVVLPTKGTVPEDELAVLTPEQIRRLNDISGISVGDVIVFQPNAGDPTLVMHRVREMTSSINAGTGQINATFITRGDNLVSDDPPVQDFQVRGRILYSLPLLGYVNNLLNAGPNAGRAAIVVAIIGYGLTVFYFARALHLSRKQRQGVQPTVSSITG